jgi:DNA-binding NtrC family response regulator
MVDASDPKSALLVVEDDPAQRQCLRRIFKAGWDVYYAETLEDAETAMARHEGIGILLCDHELPDGNGLDFCERLHQRRAPVVRILITGHTGTELLMRAVNSQCLFQFISKPCQMDHLLNVVNRAVEEFRGNEKVLHDLWEQETSANQHSVREKISHWAQIIFGVGSFFLATLIVVLLVSLVLGSLVFILLYLLKSFLGIDIFADRHLEDFLPF